MYKIINKFREIGKIPFLQRPRRKTIRGRRRNKNKILEAYREYNLRSVHLEDRSFMECTSMHIPHNTIYKVLLKHGSVEENINKKKQRK